MAGFSPKFVLHRSHRKDSNVSPVLNIGGLVFRSTGMVSPGEVLARLGRIPYPKDLEWAREVFTENLEGMDSMEREDFMSAGSLLFESQAMEHKDDKSKRQFSERMRRVMRVLCFRSNMDEKLHEGKCQPIMEMKKLFDE